jgi:hypothetical protein
MTGKSNNLTAEAGARRIVVPIEWLEHVPIRKVLIEEESAHELCDLMRRSPAGRRKKFQRLRHQLGFTQVGGLYSLEEIQRKVREATLRKAAVKNAKAMSH